MIIVDTCPIDISNCRYICPICSACITYTYRDYATHLQWHAKWGEVVNDEKEESTVGDSHESTEGK